MRPPLAGGRFDFGGRVATTDTLLQLKRADPEAYAAALAVIEQRQLGAQPERPKVEPGAPAQAAGVKTRQTDNRGVVRRPAWVTREAFDVIDTALDYAPDPNYALHTAKALGLQGWELRVRVPGTDEPHDEGQAVADAFAARVGRPYGGGLGGLLAVAMDSVLRRGAVELELEIADSSDDVVDALLVDPVAIDFQERREGVHTELDMVYLPGAGRAPVPLSRETFWYGAAGATVDKPHGQSPYLPLIDAVAPAMRLRTNLKRIGENQAFARQAFTIDTTRALEAAPPSVVKRVAGQEPQIVDWDSYRAYIDGIRDDVRDVVEAMYPDDTWILTDMIRADSVGAKHGSESFKPLELAQVFDQDAITSCLGLPAIHGRSWGAALSTTGSVQWMVYTLGLEGLREVPRRAVEWAINQYLRIRGIAAEATVEFEHISRGDIVQEAQAEEIRTRTIAAQLELGLITHEEAALALTGHGLPEGTGVGMLPEERVLATGDGTGKTSQHGAGAGCTHRLEPTRWEPEDPDPLTEGELAAGGPVTRDEAEERERAYAAWARRRAPAFAGLMAAAWWVKGDRVPSGWLYDTGDDLYRYPAAGGRIGKPLAWTRLNGLMGSRLVEAESVLRPATSALLQGNTPLSAWQRAMADQVRRAHIEAHLLGGGGLNGANPASLQRLTAQINAQYGHMARFGGDVAAGRLSEAQINARTRMYFESGPRETFRQAREELARAAGKDHERNVLDETAANCEGCEAETERGWVPIGAIKPIGERDCNGNCRCWVEHRVGGEEDRAYVMPVAWGARA